jgi:hypothetical protein
MDIDEQVRNVNITITVLGLTNGVIMKTNKNEEKKINRGDTSFLGDVRVPVVAVVSGFQEASNEQSHLPSMPLKSIDLPPNSHPRIYEFMALWPAHHLEENNGSTLTFTRRIKRRRNNNFDEGYSYSNERLTLAVSLMKGCEIITLGQVNIPFYSESNVHVQLPVRTTASLVEQAAAEMKGLKFATKKYPKRRIRKNKPIKPLAFCDDPARTFQFHEDSMLSVLVQTQVNDETVCSNSDVSEIESMSKEEYSFPAFNINTVVPIKNKIKSMKTASISDYQTESESKGEDSSVQTSTMSDGNSRHELVVDTFVNINGKNDDSAASTHTDSKTETYINSIEDVNGSNKTQKIPIVNPTPREIFENNGPICQHLDGIVSHPSNLSSPTMNDDGFQTQNVQLDSNNFPSIGVSSQSTDSGENSFEMVDEFGFPSRSVSSITTKDNAEKDNVEKYDTRKYNTRKYNTREYDTKMDDTRKYDTRKYDLRKDDSTKDDSTKDDSTKYDARKYDTRKYDLRKDDSTKDDSTKDDSTKYDARKCDTRKYDSRKYDSRKYDLTKDDSTKDDSTKDDSTKDDSTKGDTMTTSSWTFASWM